ncbi:unnamed protein product [Prorocentrum cordatum]|uniref:Rieske domain-containing protein n=1 Tax=Prorocentrum cordatum TaxID=2364126 RepID=A0ABN9UZ32_9DINO|nr:unnamed protein product [Polarella glacialis]
MEALRDHSQAALAAIGRQYPPLVAWLRAFPVSSWPLTLGNAALIWLGLWIWSPLRRPSVPRFSGATTEEVRRGRLTKLRSTCKLFPPPYPNGWYFLCRSSDVPRRQVLAVSAFGRELVAFRGESGALGVLHAFCPHLGTHLGHGGWVNGDSRCSGPSSARTTPGPSTRLASASRSRTASGSWGTTAGGSRTHSTRTGRSSASFSCGGMPTARRRATSPRCSRT